MSKTIPLYGIKVETDVGHYVWLTKTGTSPLRKKAKAFDTRAGAVMERNALAETSPKVRLIVEKLNADKKPVTMKAVKAKIAREKTSKGKVLSTETISRETPPASEMATVTESLPVVETPPDGTSKAGEPAEEKTPEVENPKESEPEAETVQESAESAPQREVVTEA